MDKGKGKAGKARDKKMADEAEVKNIPKSEKPLADPYGVEASLNYIMRIISEIQTCPKHESCHVPKHDVEVSESSLNTYPSFHLNDYGIIFFTILLIKFLLSCHSTDHI
jgi:hypothetical protein